LDNLDKAYLKECLKSTKYIGFDTIIYKLNKSIEKSGNTNYKDYLDKDYFGKNENAVVDNGE
jgi:hypothetical protein